MAYPDGPAGSSRLHLANGDVTAGRLRESRIPGVVAVWADILYEGPVPRDRTTERGRAVRADFLARRGYATRDEALGRLREWDAVFDRMDAFDEVVLWLEHDLFDQLLLIHHLHRLATRGPRGVRLSGFRVVADPEVASFRSFGELRPEVLAGLMETRTPLGTPEREAGRRAWEAFTAPDPEALQTVAAGEAPGLPYLTPALRRLLEEFPGLRDGLTRTERRLLRIAATGPVAVGTLFQRLGEGDPYYHVTDLTMERHLRELSALPDPALEIAGGGASGAARARLVVRITDTGRGLLAGRADRLRSHPPDRWIGGVHLGGSDPVWRWDARAGTLRRD